MGALEWQNPPTVVSTYLVILMHVLAVAEFIPPPANALEEKEIPSTPRHFCLTEVKVNREHNYTPTTLVSKEKRRPP